MLLAALTGHLTLSVQKKTKQKKKNFQEEATFVAQVKSAHPDIYDILVYRYGLGTVSLCHFFCTQSLIA